MITITIDDDNNFQIEGAFHLGYMGTFTNTGCPKPQLEILDDFIEVQESWSIVTNRIKGNKATKEEVAKCLTDYFNGYEEKIQQNIKQVNDNFLLNVFSNIVDMGLEFWEIDEITRKEKLPQLKGDEDYGDVIFKDSWNEMSQLEHAFYNTANDGSMEKPDVEEAIRRMFPAFHLEQLLNGVKPEVICFHDGGLAFQCSDSLNYQILCGAYDELDETLTFTDWHNF